MEAVNRERAAGVSTSSLTGWTESAGIKPFTLSLSHLSREREADGTNSLVRLPSSGTLHLKMQVNFLQM
jgi:hypothetical protein